MFASPNSHPKSVSHVSLGGGGLLGAENRYGAHKKHIICFICLNQHFLRKVPARYVKNLYLAVIKEVFAGQKLWKLTEMKT